MAKKDHASETPATALLPLLVLMHGNRKVWLAE